MARNENKRNSHHEKIELQPLDADEVTIDRAGERGTTAANDLPFELAPLAGETNGGAQRDFGKVEQVTTAFETTVPAHPPHICPNCQYNLRGLTSRRCPECGEPFTLTDAVMAAQEIRTGLRSFLSQFGWERAKFISGIVIGLAGMLAANYSGLGSGRSLVSFKGGIMTILTMPILLFMYYLHSNLGWRPSDTMIRTGLLVAGLGTILSLF